MTETPSPIPAAKEQIEQAAFRVFHDSGIKAASYSAIADASGFGRPLVQYHFPKKNDLVLRYASRFMTELRAVLDESPYSHEDDESYSVRLSQLLLHYLLRSEGMRRWTLDLLAKRELTTQLILLSNQWALPFVSDISKDDRVSTASTIATGGIYELMYVSLVNNRVPDPDSLATHGYATFLGLINDSPIHHTAHTLRAHLLAPEVISDLINQTDARLRLDEHVG